MKAVTGKRMLQLVALIGAIIAGGVWWLAPGDSGIAVKACLGLALIVVAWVQFEEQYRKP